MAQEKKKNKLKTDGWPGPKMGGERMGPDPSEGYKSVPEG